jgi:hypothetical protein
MEYEIIQNCLNFFRGPVVHTLLTVDMSYITRYCRWPILFQYRAIIRNHCFLISTNNFMVFPL